VKSEWSALLHSKISPENREGQAASDRNEGAPFQTVAAQAWLKVITNLETIPE
jgi:hypothetical protein